MSGKRLIGTLVKTREELAKGINNLMTGQISSTDLNKTTDRVKEVYAKLKREVKNVRV